MCTCTVYFLLMLVVVGGYIVCWCRPAFQISMTGLLCCVQEYKVSQYVCVFVCEYAVNCCVADQPMPASLT